jgi:arylsulfatase A-like enzyme/predicted Zn-dependent protease
MAIATTLACRRAPAPEIFPQAPVVLISIDTLRSDRLPAYGYAGVATPHLDRFRRDALLFESAWSPCPMTLPSHVTMLTGLLPPEHGVRNNVGFAFDGARHPHLPGLLKRRGYATGAAVSSYVLRGETGLAALFDEYEDSVDPRHGTGFADQQRAGRVSLSFARRWVDAQEARPFFYFFHIYEPHVPWDPPEPFRGRYPHPYDGEVAAADAVVGELLDHLRRIGVYDRAIVIVTSDHGEGLGDHGEEQHSILLYREAIQVPLLLKLPGNHRAGQRVNAPAQLADILPTVAELVGVEVPKTTSGRSLLKLGEDGLEPRMLYAETLYPRLHLGWSELHSVVDGRWHYVHGPRPELYDLARDPRETTDLVAREPEPRERLRAALGRVPTGESTPSRVDPAAAERLAALGYVGTVRDRAGSAPLPDPRDMLPQLGRMTEGFRLAAERRLDEAARVLGEVVRDQPANVEAWIRLGDVRLENGRAVEAANAYEEALARGGMEMGDIVVQLGHARLRGGQVAQAEAAAERALPSVPAKALELLARIDLARGRLDDARRHADAAPGTRNPQAAAWLVGAEVRTRQGDYAGALERLDDAESRARATGLDSVHNLEALRADALARSGRPREAEAAYRREIAAFPAHLVAHAHLAALLFAQGRRHEGRSVVEAMVASNPNPQARRVAVVTLEAVGDRAGASRFAR